MSDLPPLPEGAILPPLPTGASVSPPPAEGLADNSPPPLPSGAKVNGEDPSYSEAFFGNVLGSAKESLVDLANAPRAFSTTMPAHAEPSAAEKYAQQPMGEHLTDPKWYLAQIARGMGSMAGPGATAAVGFGVGSLAGPGGSAVGAAVGFGLGAAAQALRPSFERLYAKTNGDWNASVTGSLVESGIAGGVAMAMPAAARLRLFGTEAVTEAVENKVADVLAKPVGEKLAASLPAAHPWAEKVAQATAVQPALLAGQQTAQAAVEGHVPTLEEYATGYVQSLGVALPFLAARGAEADRRPQPPKTEPPTPTGPDVSPEAALDRMNKAQALINQYQAGLEAVQKAEGYTPNSPAETQLKVQLRKAQSVYENNKAILEESRPEILGQHPEGRAEEGKSPGEIARDESVASWQREMEAGERAQKTGALDLRGAAPTEAPPFTDEHIKAGLELLKAQRASSSPAQTSAELTGEAPRSAMEFTSEDLDRAAAERAAKALPAQQRAQLEGAAPGRAEFTPEEIAAGLERRQAEQVKPGQAGMELAGEAPREPPVFTHAEIELALAMREAERKAQPATQTEAALEGAAPYTGLPDYLAAARQILAHEREQKGRQIQGRFARDLNTPQGAPRRESETAPVAGPTEPSEQAYAELPKQPHRLTSWLLAKGGLQDEGGEISHITGGKNIRPLATTVTRGGKRLPPLVDQKDIDSKYNVYPLIRAGGMTLDDAAVRAQEEGYFHDMPTAAGVRGARRASIDDLLEALRDDLGGQPRYSVYDTDAADAFHSALEHNHKVDELAQEYGLDPNAMSRQEFFDAVEKHETNDKIEDGLGHEAFEADRPLEESYGEPEFDIPGFGIEDIESERRQTKAAEDMASGEAHPAVPGGPARPEAAGKEGAGRSGRGVGTAGREGPGYERTEQGEQAVIPGAEPRTAQETTAHQAEEAARRKAEQDQLAARTFTLTPGETPKQTGGPELPLPPPRLEIPKEESPPAFFSALTDAIEATSQPKAPASQWANIIRNLSQKGVKQSEIEWSGVLDWLNKKGGASVTRDQLLNFLHLNEVHVEETLKGGMEGPSQSDRAALQNWLDERYGDRIPIRDYFRNAEEGAAAGDSESIGALEQSGAPDQLISPYRDNSGGPTRFPQYNLPGAQNYRELLLTWPQGTRNEAARAEVFDRYQPQIDALRARHDASGDMNERAQLRHEEEILQLQRAREATEAGYKEIQHTQNHWGGQPNVLAHVRFDDRTTPDGKRVLHIAEIQSDWHQQGRRRGYRDQAALDAAAKRAGDALKNAREVNRDLGPKLEKELQELPAADAAAKNVGRFYAEGPDGKIDFENNDRTTVERWMRDFRDPDRPRKLGYGTDDSNPYVIKHREIVSRITDLNNKINEAEAAYRQADEAHHAAIENAQNQPPRGPLADQWHEVAMKRMLRYAVENGYDRIVWDTGATNAERYNLSHQISRLDWLKNKDGTVNLAADKNGHEVFTQENIPPAKLPDYVGKEIADKIMAGEGKHWGVHPEHDMGQLSGLDLRVGGEGMRGFYDKILPTFVNKYAGKWGAKVSRDRVQTDTPENTSEVHAVDITPKMRDAVMRGQPLWAPTAKESVATEYRNLNDDFSSFYTKGGYPLETHDIPAFHDAARDYVVDRGRESGNEHAVLIDRQHGALGAFTSDKGDSVAFDSPAIYDPAASVTVHHNHPITLPLSSRDVGVLGYPGVDRTVAHGHDGEAFSVRLTPEAKAWALNLSPTDAFNRIASLWEKARDIARPSLLAQYRLGKISEEDFTYLLPEMANRSLAAAGLTEYRTPYSGWPLPDSVARNIIKRGAEAVTGNARKDGLTLKNGDEINAYLDRFPAYHSIDEILGEISGRHEVASEGSGIGVRDQGGGKRATAPQEVQGQKILARLNSPETILPGSPDAPSWLDRTKARMEGIKGAAHTVAETLQKPITPMAVGAPETRAPAKDFANAGRHARYARLFFDKPLRKMSDADLTHMWNVNDLASRTAQLEGEDAGRAVLDTLPEAQRDWLLKMDEYASVQWEAARASGLVAPESVRLPFYTPRKILDFTDPKAAKRLQAGEFLGENNPQLDRLGTNLSSAGPKSRTYFTPEETEEAAKAKFGAGASIVRNIRTLPLELERFENAIAGRQLINAIKDLSAVTGEELVEEGKTTDAKKFFTLPHPALMESRVRLGPDGQVVRDKDGNAITDRVPLYISRKFEGPLRAVLRSDPGAVERAMMQMKAGAMSTIMYSPLIHNMVEWGRALPVLPGKVMTGLIYYDGAKFLRDFDGMSRAIREGYVPIGNRGYRMDITGIADAPYMRPGESVPSRMGRYAGDKLWGINTGDMIANAVDTAGDFWHNKLLWNWVARLQAGLYVNLRKELIAGHLGGQRGVPMDPEAAGIIAAHFANRYAGALPREAMGEMATKIANLGLFSRTFTIGNLGVVKDMFTGLPRDVQAQIGRDLGAVEMAAAKGIARRKAIGAFMLDVALFYAGNALLQSGLDYMRGKKGSQIVRAFGGPETPGLPDIENEYAERVTKAMNRLEEHPLDVLTPWGMLESAENITPQGQNEPHKRDRVLFAADKDGTALYLRAPVGKVGEDFAGVIRHPSDIFLRKMSPVARSIWETITNDRGFGHKVYNESPHGFDDIAQNVGNVVWNFMRNQVPAPQIEAAKEVVMGNTKNKDMVNLGRALLPMFGLTMSRGYSGPQGGPQGGYEAQARKDREYQLQQILPAIRDQYQNGQETEAVEAMQKAGITQDEIKRFTRYWQTEGRSPSKYRTKQFMRHATPQQVQEFEQTNTP